MDDANASPKMDATESISVWKVNVVGANVTVTEPQNPNATVIVINGGDKQSNAADQVSDKRR